ncbi:MAG TPA: hypothetical protein VLN45_03195 [Ignavibacteriaceae bacterium]|nr:hypothetical protein [Ignavibacteriaceae bacterium]
MKTSQKGTSTFFPVGNISPSGVLKVPDCVPRPANSTTAPFSSAKIFLI